jgi:hypothetical protein
MALQQLVLPLRSHRVFGAVLIPHWRDQISSPTGGEKRGQRQGHLDAITASGTVPRRRRNVGLGIMRSRVVRMLASRGDRGLSTRRSVTFCCRRQQFVSDCRVVGGVAQQVEYRAKLGSDIAQTDRSTDRPVVKPAQLRNVIADHDQHRR